MNRLLLITLLLLLWLQSCLYTVDASEFAFVTQFGQPVATLDGATDAGLHVKLPWPVQSVQRLDRRAPVLHLPPADVLPHGPQGQTIHRPLPVEAVGRSRVARPRGRGGVL